MQRLAKIGELHSKAISYFGKDFLELKDTNNPISNSWKYLSNAYEITEDKNAYLIVPQAKEIILTLNYLEIFVRLKLIDAELNPIDNPNIIERFHSKVICDLKKKDTFEETKNFISFPAFLEEQSIELFPILESGQKTPDYLAIFQDQRVLIECKSANLSGKDIRTLKNKVEKIVKKSKVQLSSYPNLPGICLFRTNDPELFFNQDLMMDFISKKIDRDGENISAIVFTLFVESDFPRIRLEFLPFLNFRSIHLLPKSFFQEIFNESGTLLISSRVGDRHLFSEIERISTHYGIDPKLDEIERKFSSK